MIGDSVRKPDARAKVTGEERYAGDVHRPDMLHALTVFTDQVHARISRLDMSAAEAVDGVVAVITAADVPVNEYGLIFADQPVLIGPDHSGRSQVRCDVSRWEADHLAVVVAESPEVARAAALLIEADWEQLPILSGVDAALPPDPPLLHEENGCD